MISDKQLEADRANARKSTGPNSAAGKNRSSLSALRHQATGQVVVLPQQDMQAYDAFIAAIIASFQPHDAHEIQLAQCYAGFHWRINRIAAVEDSLFTLGLMEEVAENLNIENADVHNAATNAKTFRQDSRAFDRLSMYSHRLMNSAAKVLKQLEHTQAQRREREKQQMLEAARLYQFHRMQKTTFHPHENGFDLTLDQIQAHISCTILHNQAEIAENLKWDRPKYLQATSRAA